MFVAKAIYFPGASMHLYISILLWMMNISERWRADGVEQWYEDVWAREGWWKVSLIDAMASQFLSPENPQNVGLRTNTHTFAEYLCAHLRIIEQT